MSDLITITGNLTSAPERREVGGGAAMATFGLASTERRLENGSWVDGHTNFYNVSVFRRLAEHTLRSLEKGQRVIVVGKLRVRRWEVNGRTGVSVDLEASSLGPDLMFGVATFEKDLSSSASATSATPHGGDGWAADGADIPDAAQTGAAGAEGDRREASSVPDLVGAGAWGAPGADEQTPF